MQKRTFAGVVNGPVRKTAAIAVVALVLGGCVVVPDRPALSTLGCARAVLRDRVPPGLEDKPTHCMAAAMIARYCSRSEAALASIGKELKDLFSAGDAEWADLQADREGLHCAKGPGGDSAVRECCQLATGSQPRLRN